MNIYNRFKKLIGMYDATNEYIELLRREFNHQVHSKENPNTYLTELSVKHKIKLSEYRIEDADNIIIKNYLVSVNVCFESFLKDVNELGKKYAIKWDEKKKKDSWLKCIYDNIIRNNDDFIELYMLCNYYRGVRNISVHSIKKQGITVADLSPYYDNIIDKFPKLDAPNDIDKLNFDDFIMYTRAAKELGRVMFDNLEYDLNKIVDSFESKKYNGFQNNKVRLRKSINEQMKMDFNLNDNDVQTCIDKIIDTYY